MPASEKMIATEFATNLIPTMRSWSETVFRTALEGRPEAEIDQIVDQFYAAYEAEVIAIQPDMRWIISTSFWRLKKYRVRFV